MINGDLMTIALCLALTGEERSQSFRRRDDKSEIETVYGGWLDRWTELFFSEPGVELSCLAEKQLMGGF